MSLTKATYSMIKGACGNVLDYGAYSDGTNATATTAAFTAALAANSRVYVPTGTYAINDTIVIPEFKTVFGEGPFATIINATLGSGKSAFQLGANVGSLNYYTNIQGLLILLKANNTTGVLLYGTCSANVDTINIQQDGATNCTGFAVDGINSSFFNLFKNCYALHCHIGFDHFSSGTGPGEYATQQIYLDCSVFGDYPTDTTSVGYFFRALAVGGGNGNETSIFGGNCENCHVGVSIAGQDDPNYGSGSPTGISLFGTRFENNEYDLDGNTFATNCTFIGLKNLTAAKIRNLPNPQDGYGNNTFLGNGYATPADSESKIESAVTIYAPKASGIPLTIQAYTGQTDPILILASATGSNLAYFAKNGQLTLVSSAAAGPVGSVTFGGGAPSTTVGAAGGAAALPATPLGYITAFVGATEVKIPYYNP